MDTMKLSRVGHTASIAGNWTDNWDNVGFWVDSRTMFGATGVAGGLFSVMTGDKTQDGRRRVHRHPL